MTIVAANWIGENTSTVGTGPLALSGAISTFCPFSVLADGSEVYYTLQEGFNRETGIGVVSNGTLTRNVQATLVAGVYTETNIPISLVGNGQVFAVINADFITRIYNLSLDIDNSVSAAAASAQASADSADLANDYKTQSAKNAEDAAASAMSASDSKVSANASKNAAASSAAAAASSQADALASKNAAADSQADALASKNAAKTSETNSKASETASAQSATNASNSAAAALASQNAAKTSEDNAAVSRTGAGQSALAAKDSENAAKTSETNSKTSETNAKDSETNAASSATSAANSAALAQQYQPNTALQLFTTYVNATAGNTMSDNLADGVYPVTADSPGAPLAVTGKVWVAHRGTACQQTWESQAAAGATNYGRKFFRTGVDDGAGGITWGDWREHVFVSSNGIAKTLLGVDSTFRSVDSSSAVSSVTSAPGNSTTTNGGVIHSSLEQNGSEIGGANLKYQHVVGLSGAVSKSAVIEVANGSGSVSIDSTGAIKTSNTPRTRDNLGLGTAATSNIGTSGATIPLLSTVNTWSSNQNFLGNLISTDKSLMLGGGLSNNSGISYWGTAQVWLKLGADRPNPNIMFYAFEDVGIQSGLRVQINYASIRNDYNFLDSGTATAVNWSSTSDGELKGNITQVGNALAATLSMRGVTWDWNKKGLPGIRGVGIIAQEAEAWCPEAVEHIGRAEKFDGTVVDNARSLNTGALAAAYHTEAIRTLFDMVKSLANGDPESVKAAIAEVESLIKPFYKNGDPQSFDPPAPIDRG